jgi:hypothetical protein
LFAQSSYFEGFVYDEHATEELLFATVMLYQNNELVTGTTTDLEGRFNFKDIAPGKYNLEASYLGYETKRKKITLTEGKNTGFVGLKIKRMVITEAIIISYDPCTPWCCHWGCGGTVCFETETDIEEVVIEKREAIEHKSIKEDAFKVFPNPAPSFTTIELEESLESVQIYDMSERLLFSKINPKGGRIHVDVSTWIDGMYAVVFERTNETVVQRLVVIN